MVDNGKVAYAKGYQPKAFIHISGEMVTSGPSPCGKFSYEWVGGSLEKESIMQA